jgi:AAHS family 4-hydroxybenzoate transporter-like MFS transporter
MAAPSPIRPQRWLLWLVGLTVVMDGFDIQAMSFVAPALVKEMGIARASLGPVFSAGLAGMLFGSLGLSLLADRIGRRPVLLGATAFFAVSMLATSTLSTLPQLEIARFVTGLGLGAIMPNAMALAGEYSPPERRVSLMMLVSCGLTGGAVIGGLLSAGLIAHYGWRSVFVCGGVLPALLFVLLYFKLPESQELLAARATRTSQSAGAPVAALFRHGRAFVTTVLWVVNFMNLLDLYFLSSWIPTIASGAGLSTTQAVLLGTILQVGGVVGPLSVGPIIDRIGFRKVMVPLFLVGAVAVLLIGRPEVPLAALFVVVFVAGVCIVGGQPAVNALAGMYYPTNERSTGIGWSLGVGRIGSIVGPLVGGVLLRLQWSNARIFGIVAVPALVSAAMLALLRPGRGDLEERAR